MQRQIFSETEQGTLSHQITTFIQTNYVDTD